MKLPIPRFDIGTIVYPKVDSSTDHALMVTGYVIRGSSWFAYLATDADGDEKERYEHELTNEVKWSAQSDDSET